MTTRDHIARIRSVCDEMERDLNAEATSEIVVTAPKVPEAANDDAAFAFSNYPAFYNFLRGNKMLGPKIIATEFKGCDDILKACAQANWPISWTAYALATAYHETAHSMQPIHELGGVAYLTRMYDINGQRPKKARELGNLSPGDGAKFGGRGYVQLTGKNNYAKATAKLRALGYDVDLVANPDLAMRPDLAAIIMVQGMTEGWFTTRKVPDDLPRVGPAGRQGFILTRDVINGSDKDDLIAGYAVDFQTGLTQGGYNVLAA